MAEPLFAFAQQADQQVFELALVVVEVREQYRQGVAGGARALQLGSQIPHRGPQQRFGVFAGRETGTQTRFHRELARQQCAERIDRMDLQSVGRARQIPARGGVPRRHRARQFPVAAFELVRGRLWLLREFQCAQDAPAHFARGLAGEGHAQHFLGFGAGGEQAQHALGEQAGFAGAGRRRHRKRTRGVQGFAARVLIRCHVRSRQR
jgi:hypothetical protein